MMLKPSIDSLLKKVDSKYSLVILASKRAHELETGATPMKEEFYSVKPVGQALEEIDAGDVVVDPNPELKRELIRQKEELEAAERTREREIIEAKIREEN
ncbi:DNA-directed RNA polymerase subunit omega [Vagococcus lutrae]|uniref:DNA-directed RNA polymerase subunit omega n=1 Tax=Vagococcus lutrae LBD1 TaxID=1408226 RepID=V6Q4M8_9ENTE|nr:DNA-directed RNA polymerase subunit omega [Vagococcus lutrae]EST90191.1 DNA-directed RNA polymerase, omega subunit [Vagococcus lutrae LBD1]NKZ28359.1 DNA-directed RNA polymerase subunit omega [Vagococcus lutrae]